MHMRTMCIRCAMQQQEQQQIHNASKADSAHTLQTVFVRRLIPHTISMTIINLCVLMLTRIANTCSARNG